MRVNPAYMTHRLGNKYMIVDNCTDNSNLATVYTLNSSAGFLWLRAKEMESFTAETLAETLCNEYDVDYPRALADAEAITRQWADLGLLLDDNL